MYSKIISNRIIDNFNHYLNDKSLYESLAYVKPATITNWKYKKNFPFTRKHSLLLIKDSLRINKRLNLAKENQRFCNKLINCKPNYNIKKYYKDFDKNQQLCNKISRYNWLHIPPIIDKSLMHRSLSTLNKNKQKFKYSLDNKCSKEKTQKSKKEFKCNDRVFFEEIGECNVDIILNNIK